MEKPFTRNPYKKAGLHALILSGAVFLIFFWVTSETLSYYSLQFTAVLLVMFIFLHKLVDPVTFKLVESTISTIAVLLIVTATGNISSPLFFLIYFLQFELSLLLEPVIPLVLSVVLIIFFLLTNNLSTTQFRLLELIAFPFMMPLAYFTGKIYRKEENQKKEIKTLEKKIDTLQEELVEEELRN